jgi:hypothetical protein
MVPRATGLDLLGCRRSRYGSAGWHPKVLYRDVAHTLMNGLTFE